MTERAAPLPAPVGPLPRWWWARGLNLRERLDARRPPVGRTPVGAARPALWSVADRTAVAERLAALELSAALADALSTEPPQRLGARTGKPDWASYTERAVAAAPQRSATRNEVLVQAEGHAVFLPVLRPLILPAWDAVAAGLTLPPDEHGPVREAFEQRLGDQLTRQAARTLVTELSRARAAGRLSGRDPRERFASFVARIGTSEGLGRLFSRYPVLARMLAQTAADAACAMIELTGRLQADRDRIARELFPDTGLGTLIRLELGRGDAHQGNRSVVLVHCEHGSVVYKPRPIEQHALLDEAAAWLSAKVPGLDLRTPRSVRGDGYGWLEFVEQRWCESVIEADRFYRRQGALLALLYAMDGTDMHCENLIASGDQPVLVDAETLLHSGLPFAATAGADPAATALHASVHRTGLLPHLVIGEYGALDLSALGGRTGSGLEPSDVLCWEGVGTDEMRAVRGTAAGPATDNRPLPSAGAGHSDHRAALLEGFRTSYDAIARNRDELLGAESLLTRGGQSPARLIARATRFYGTLLAESTHPGLLRDALARDAVFALLWTESRLDPARQRLIEDEIADLWRGDIPVFFHRPAQTAVWTSRGARLDALLPEPSLETVRTKIADMGPVDRYDQEWVISAALAVSSAESGRDRPRSRLVRRPASAAVPTPGRLLAAACGIADEIGAAAIRHGGRANWLSLERVDGRHWAVMPMGGGLGEGYCGVALFLAEIGRVARTPRYTELAREALRPLPLLLANMAEDPELCAAVGPGALSGLGGIGYALVRLSALLGDEIGACLPDAVLALSHAVDGLTDHPLHDGAPLDLADGLAGALVGALAAGSPGAPGAADARRLASSVADRLLEHCLDGKSAAGPGFAHGDAGIGWALLRYAATPDFASAAGPHAAAGSALLRSALNTALRERDLRWYSGLSGVVLAAAEALGPAERRTAAGGFNRFVRQLSGPVPGADLSLRQGAAGLLEPLLVLAGRGHGGAREALTRRVRAVLGTIEQQGHLCGTPDHVPTPGLLSGLSGIGHTLLRLGYPGQVPSLALFAPTGRESGQGAASRKPSSRPALP